MCSYRGKKNKKKKTFKKLLQLDEILEICQILWLLFKWDEKSSQILFTGRIKPKILAALEGSGGTFRSLFHSNLPSFPTVLQISPNSWNG